MRFQGTTLTILPLLASLVGCAGTLAATDNTALQDSPTAPDQLTVWSDEFAPGGAIPNVHAFNQFGCTGDNLPLAVRWSGAPTEAKSYAVVVHDPDAPTGVGFFHWVLSNLPAETQAVGGGTPLPAGVREHHNDYGGTGYGGMCPPADDGPHRYIISVYALDTPDLELPEGATGALMRFALASHTLAYGRLVGTYSR